MDNIAGITYADTNVHYVDLSSLVDTDCQMVIVVALRTAGTGQLQVYPGEGANYLTWTSGANYMYPLAIFNQRIKLALTVANDTWTIYVYGALSQQNITQVPVTA